VGGDFNLPSTIRRVQHLVSSAGLSWVYHDNCMLSDGVWNNIRFDTVRGPIGGPYTHFGPLICLGAPISGPHTY
jgi:hypothetical protein